MVGNYIYIDSGAIYAYETGQIEFSYRGLISWPGDGFLEMLINLFSRKHARNRSIKVMDKCHGICRQQRETLQYEDL